MNKIDQDPLETLETLLKEATQGSVYVSYDEDGFPVIHLDENDENEDSYDPIARFSAGVPNDRHDAALYAHLRNLAPALLEEVRTSRARIESLSAEVERWKNNADSERLRADEAEARVRALEEALRTIFDDPSNFLCDKAEQVCRAALGEHND